VLDPVGFVLGVGDEHDLVGGEDTEPVCDRLERLGVADRPGDLDPVAP